MRTLLDVKCFVCALSSAVSVELVLWRKKNNERKITQMEILFILNDLSIAGVYHMTYMRCVLREMIGIVEEEENFKAEVSYNCRYWPTLQ